MSVAAGQGWDTAESQTDGGGPARPSLPYLMKTAKFSPVFDHITWKKLYSMVYFMNLGIHEGPRNIPEIPAKQLLRLFLLFMPKGG